MAAFGTDQDIVQRMLTAETPQKARRSLITAAFMDLSCRRGADRERLEVPEAVPVDPPPRPHVAAFLRLDGR